MAVQGIMHSPHGRYFRLHDEDIIGALDGLSRCELRQDLEHGAVSVGGIVDELLKRCVGVGGHAWRVQSEEDEDGGGAEEKGNSSARRKRRTVPLLKCWGLRSRAPPPRETLSTVRPLNVAPSSSLASISTLKPTSRYIKNVEPIHLTWHFDLIKIEMERSLPVGRKYRSGKADARA